MSITENQDLPSRPEEEKKWTTKKLFPAAAIASVITKVFASPFDILLGFTILILGLIELFGRHASWGFYVLAVLLLFSSIFEKTDMSIFKKQKDK